MTEPMLASIHSTLLHLAVPLADLRQHPQNPREADEDVIRESLILNGQYGPVIVQRSTGYLLAGNGTYAAALSLGWTHLAAVLLDVDDAHALRILLADNRLQQVGQTDPEALLSLLRTLDGEFGGSGYTTGDFSDLLTILDAHVQDAAAPPATVTGDLRSLVLSYEQAEFDRLVAWLLGLREHEGQTFTEIIRHLVADAVAA